MELKVIKYLKMPTFIIYPSITQYLPQNKRDRKIFENKRRCKQKMPRVEGSERSQPQDSKPFSNFPKENKKENSEIASDVAPFAAFIHNNNTCNTIHLAFPT